MTSFTTDYNNNNNTISQINIEEDDGDEEMQLDEMEALNSIFGHNFKILKNTVPRMIEIDNIENHIKLIASLPSTYPSIQPPKCTLSIICQATEGRGGTLVHGSEDYLECYHAREETLDECTKCAFAVFGW